jgi:hypothetical protein
MARTKAEKQADRTEIELRITQARRAARDVRTALKALPANGGTAAQQRDRAVMELVLRDHQVLLHAIGAVSTEDRED